MNKKSKTLLFVSIGLFILVLAVSYYRFFVIKHYIVQYQASCDPVAESCFIYECTETDSSECETIYYKIIKKYASDLYTTCGRDIQDCPGAENCTVNDALCEVEYCDPTVVSNDFTCASYGEQ